MLGYVLILVSSATQ
jgi:serine/threonine protein kinase